MPQADIGLLKRAIARIRHANGDVVGAGFLVSDSCLLTCAHVVTEALGLPQETAETPTGLIELDFPHIPNSPSLAAQVIFWNPVNPGKRGEDIAGLQIVEASPVGAQPLSLLPTSSWWKHPFGTFGFPQGHANGIWASGEMKEQIGGQGWVQIEAIRAEGYPVLPGFSGSPVWDEQEGGIVGMTVAAERKRTEARAAFMIPTAILADAIEALSLIELLSPYYNIVQQPVRTVFNACCPPGWSRSLPKTLPAVITELQEMPQGDSRFRPIVQFAARLAMAAPEIEAVLKNWVIAQGQSWQKLVQQVEPVLTLSPMSYLFIKIEDTKPKSEEHLVTAVFAPDYGLDQRWIYRCRQVQVPPPPDGQSGFKLDNLPALLNELLNQVDEFSNLTIEFFLPVELLNQAVDRWETEGLGIPQMIGHEYQVVVRSVERLTPTYKRYKGSWQKKWRTLQQIQQQRAAEALVCGEGCDLRG
jgi:vWA-MoxR associated protein C-terminal domain/Trypsin-like peptidase domain/vWA-MoxR associated protein middle region (VMAP-M) 1